MSKEEAMFSKASNRVNLFWKPSGIHFDEKDINGTIKLWFSTKVFFLNFIWLISHLLGEILWIIDELRSEDKNIVLMMCLIPCMTLSLLGCFKSFFLMRNSNIANELLRKIRLLQSHSAKSAIESEIENELSKKMVFLTTVITTNAILDSFGLLVFAIGPLVVTYLTYTSTGQLEMNLPFPAKFPFDETDIIFWPFAYFHQLWAAALAISTMHGTDGFYTLVCTFLVIQFRRLQKDIERIIPENFDFALEGAENLFRSRFNNIVRRHLELIRCVDIVETVFSKSSLCNVAVSSLVLCISAFNITTIEDSFFKSVFIAFLIMWTIQVFVLCYYSDLLIESSTEVSNAVYKSKWYIANAAVMKDLLFVLTRSQKPCKLTAAGFTDLNLRVFSRSMSSAWSYFAILHTVYNK